MDRLLIRDNWIINYLQKARSAFGVPDDLLRDVCSARAEERGIYRELTFHKAIIRIMAIRSLFWQLPRMWIPLDCRALSGAGNKILDVSCEWAAHFTKQKREWKVFYRLLDRKTMDNGDNVYCFLSSTKQGEEGKRNNFRKFFGWLLNVHELNWKIQFKRLPWGNSHRWTMRETYPKHRFTTNLSI